MQVIYIYIFYFTAMLKMELNFLFVTAIFILLENRSIFINCRGLDIANFFNLWVFYLYGVISTSEPLLYWRYQQGNNSTRLKMFLPYCLEVILETRSWIGKTSFPRRNSATQTNTAGMISPVQGGSILPTFLQLLLWHLAPRTFLLYLHYCSVYRENSRCCFLSLSENFFVLGFMQIAEMVQF